MAATNSSGRVSGLRRYFPFTYKIMLAYLLVVSITVTAIGFVSYTVLVDTRTEMAETNIRTAMVQTLSSLQYQLDEITRMSDTLFSSIPFQRALQKQGQPLEIYHTMLDEIVPQLQAPLLLFGNDLRVVLYTLNGSLNHVPGDDLATPITGSDYYILAFEEVRDLEWMREIREEGLDNLWLQVDTDRKLGNISHVRKLVSFNDYQTIIGYLRITASLEQLLGDFAVFPEESGVSFRLYDTSSGETLYQGGAAAGGQGEATALRLTETVPNTGYALEMTVPYSYLKRDAARLRRLVGVAGLLAFLFMSLIGYLVANLSHRKMRRIISLIRAFQEGNFHKQIRFSGNDEFVRIGEAFNRMATNIRELINRVYVQGIQKKQAELEALQAQIHPHFLYNTLSTISSLANMGEIAKVTEMVRGLAKFYRLTLNEGQVLIPLAKELEQVGTYLDIQRVKYADAFSVHVDVEPELLERRVIKLILQPFVENVFKHAWFGETIAIRITGRRKGEAIELKVIDNGVGMRPETVKRLMKQANAAGGYGLKNVDERIKLRFGPSYGVSISSLYGAGTAVRIMLPFDGAGGEEEPGGKEREVE